jgi:hypothetical protein
MLYYLNINMVEPYDLIIILINIFYIILLLTNCFFNYVMLLYLLFFLILYEFVNVFVIVIIIPINYLFMGKVGFKYNRLRFEENISHFID